MAYAQTELKVAGSDDVVAADINDIRAELKAAAMGLLLSSVVVTTFAYNGDGTINTITYVDADADANLDFDAVTTFTYSSGLITVATTVFSKLGITLTETFAYTGSTLDSITPAFS